MLFAQACTCSGAADHDVTQGEGDVVFVDEGQGDTNGETLWQLRAGYRQAHIENRSLFRDYGEQAYDTFLGQEIDFGGVRLMPLGNAAWEEFFARGYPSEPSYWMLVSQSEDGSIWWGGTARLGLFAERVLLVPETVRVGMKWESRIGGDTVLEGEVVARDVQETVFGERPVWTFEYTWHLEPREGGTWPQVRLSGASFIEGRGPGSSLPFLGDGEAIEDDFLIIHPLDQGLPAADLEPIELTPLHAGEPVADAMLARHMSAIPDGEGGWIVTLFGRRDLAGLSFAEVENEMACVRLSDDGGTEVVTADPDDLCKPGAGVSYAADGRGYRVTTTARGAPSRPSETCTSNCPPATHQGAFLSAAGRFATLATSKRRPRRPDGLWIVDVEDGVSIDDEFLGWMPFDLTSTADLRVDLTSNTPTYPLHIEADASGDLRVLRPQPRMHVAHYDAETGQTDAFEVLPRFGSYNVNSYPGGQAITTAQFDGRIDSLELLPDGLGMRTLGRVRAPAGEFVTAALELEDRLLVATQRNYEGGDPWYRDGAPDFSYETSFGEAMLYEAPLPAATTPEKPSNLWGVTGARSSQDALICWPNVAAQLEGTWSLGGEEAEALLSEDGRCALLLRRGELAATETPSDWTVEGTIPGVGRVAIGGLHSARDSWLVTMPNGAYGGSQLAPVQGGGFVDERGFTIDSSTSRARYANHLYEFANPWWSNISLISHSAPDTAGNGQWVVRFGKELGSTDLTPALLSPSGLVSIDGDFGSVGTLVTASEGGGAMFMSHPNGTSPLVVGVHAFRIDGTIVVLPTPSYGSVDFRLADDTTCGASFFDGDLKCTSAEGVESTIGTPLGDPSLAMIRPGDGVYWPAVEIGAGEATLLERYADGVLEPVTVNLASVGLSAGAPDIQWRQDIEGTIVGAVKTAEGGLLLRVADGVITAVECDQDIDTIALALYDGPAMAVYSSGVLLDLERGRRYRLGEGCRIF